MAGDYIRQAAPNNPVLANKWVGLTLSTVFDPVMYLSFGATGPTKVIASRLLAHQTEAALTDANRIIHTESGLYRMADGTTHKFNDPLELMMQIKHGSDTICGDPGDGQIPAAVGQVAPASRLASGSTPRDEQASG